METGCDTLPQQSRRYFFKVLILKVFKKLARTLLYLTYKNKKNAAPNKNNTKRL